MAVACYLYYILSIYRKFLLSQFFSSGIRMHIAILRGVQNERISKNQKKFHF